MALRIGIAGAGGTGKSGLASELASKLGVAYLPAKNITRPILDRLGYDYSSGMYVEEFLASAECQSEILDRTVKAEGDADGRYVIDRTSVDIAAYAAVLIYKKIDKVDEIVGVCREHAKGYSSILLCPWDHAPLVPNGVRTLNPWLQLAIHGAIVALLDDWKVPYTVLPQSNGDRLAAALRAVR
jgi:hypothetical protein